MTGSRVLGALRPQVERLAALGFTGYDAAVLSCLVYLGDANSAQLAEASGVPRTSIYGAADRLVARGLAEARDSRAGQRWSIDGETPGARWTRVTLRLADEARKAHAARLAALAALGRSWPVPPLSPGVDNPGDDQRPSL